MSRLAELAHGVRAVIARDAAIYFSFRLRFVSQAVIALFSLTLFHYVSRLVGVRRFPEPETYFAYVVVGLMILQLLTATLSSVPNALRGELVARTFERMAVSALGPSASVAAMVAFPALMATFNAIVMLGMAIVVFGLDLAGPEALLAVPATLLALLAFAPFSLLTAAIVMVSKQAGSVASLTVLGLSLAGGVYFPTDLLPAWLSWVAEIQPFTPALDLLRALLVDADGTGDTGGNVLRLVGFAIVANPIALVALDAAVRTCRRRGTLTES